MNATAGVEMPIVARFEYTRTDYLAASRQTEVGPRRFFGVLTVILVGILLRGYTTNEGAMYAISHEIKFQIFAAFSLLSAGYVLYYTPRAFARLNLRTEAGPVTFALDADGVSVSDLRSSGRFEWAWFHAARGTRDMIVLKPQKEISFLLPKRSLAPGDLEGVRTLLRRQAHFKFP